MLKAELSDWGGAGRGLILLAMVWTFGCASGAKPPASGALSEDEAAARYQDLTVQAVVVAYSGSIWRGMISEPLTEDEQRGLYVLTSERNQEEFVARIEAALGVAVPAVDFREGWIEDWKDPIGPKTERGPGSERVPHLKMLLVETWIQHYGLTYDLSVVVMPADPADSGEPLVVFDDYVVHDVEIWFENELSGDVKATVPRFVIDRTDYPAGSRHYGYSRTIGRWNQPARLRAVTDEMLAELRQDLVRDGFLDR